VTKAMRETVGFDPRQRVPGAAALYRHANPLQIAAGAAAVLTLQTLRIRLDDRWPRRRETVWEAAEQVFARHLRADERFERIGESEFLLVTDRGSPVASIAVAVEVSQDLLNEFMAGWRPQDIDVARVVGVEDKNILVERLSPGELKAATAEWAAAEEALRRQSPLASGRVDAIPFVSAQGKRMELTLTPEPVINLKHGQQTGVRLARGLADLETGKRLSSLDRVHLDANDLAFIDQAVLRESLSLLRYASQSGPVIIPLSFHTLSRTGARTRLFQEAGLAPGDMQNPWIAEISDLEPGAPNGRVTETAGLLRPYTATVFAEPLAKRPAWRGMTEARIAGAALDLHDRKLADAEIAKLMLNFGDKANATVRTLLCYGLPSAAFFDIAMVAGFSHATVRAGAEVQAAA
jgi:hypothetical protein